MATPYSGSRFDFELGGDRLVALLEGIDAYIAGSAHLSRDVIERAPALKLISRRGVGYERIDLAAARDRNVLVTITTGANQHAVADHVFGLLLAVARHLIDAHRCIGEGRWELFTGPELRGKTLGIVGLGRVGKGVARRAQGFSMRVVATDPVIDDAFARAHDIAYLPLEELLGAADVVSINASLNATTRGLIDGHALNRMRDGAILINTARGAILDEGALIGALERGHLGGVGLDVFEDEPRIPQRLSAIPRAILLPHIGSAARKARARMAETAAQSIADLFAGRRPAHPLNPEVL